ncbi:MAG: tRNA (adenine-N1)-methyltransferase [Candidatus Hadarchaeum sp.]|uniref:tRNA (adenine-N1)-methyltransferase n=1 Tax=Candidatus Hadarchaeum sp. TaxID=2883567 RepID=UPI003D0E092A
MISDGERIILIDEEGRRYLVQAAQKKLHTKFGVVDLAETIGKEPGARIKSHLGKDFVLLRPAIVDYLHKLHRVPQIMLPKDAGQIVAHTGVGPGSRVVDAGAGSGALAIFLGNLVRPTGWVISYEVREDFAKIAEENIRMAGLDDIVKVKNKDIYQSIDETGLDLITLDLPQPELVLPHAQQALKPGGYLAVFTPCVEHLQRLYREFGKFSFTNISTIECLVREIEVRANCTRPSTRMIAHTGYLTFARRL